MAVFDAALLVETGSYRDYDRLLVASCSRETQLRRLLSRGGITRREAESRINAQAPLKEKLAVADYVIETDRELEITRDRTGEVYRSLLEDFEKFSGGDGI